jgi:hypothetical protein
MHEKTFKNNEIHNKMLERLQLIVSLLKPSPISREQNDNAAATGSQENPWIDH